MIKRTIYELKGIYRDTFRVTGYEFGVGEKSVCIVGSSRGNEVQQIYCCSQLVKKMKQLEEEKRILEGHKVLVIPSINPYSMNIHKRFWSTDNTDINRMFPGYDRGETTQRIADGVFREISEYQFGIQFTSFYMPGDFVPEPMVKAGEEVRTGQPLANILNPHEGDILETFYAPSDRIVFFVHNEPLTYADTAVIKLIEKY